MSCTMTLLAEDSIPTRYTLLSRLKNWEDQASWKDFFDTYWRLIYSVALKSGLTEAEAQDVVQETVISVAHDIHKFKRDRSLGSFKGWLRNLTRWRIADQFRKRTRARQGDDSTTAESVPWPDMAEIPDPAGDAGESIWDEEWQTNLLKAALASIKRHVKEEHFQIFDLYVLQQQPVKDVARTFGIHVGLVYLVKFRMSALLKKEVRRLEAQWNQLG